MISCYCGKKTRKKQFLSQGTEVATSSEMSYSSPGLGLESDSSPVFWDLDSDLRPVDSDLDLDLRPGLGLGLDTSGLETWT